VGLYYFWWDLVELTKGILITPRTNMIIVVVIVAGTGLSFEDG
jgi:hypothetical protein